MGRLSSCRQLVQGNKAEEHATCWGWLLLLTGHLSQEPLLAATVFCVLLMAFWGVPLCTGDAVVILSLFVAGLPAQEPVVCCISKAPPVRWCPCLSGSMPHTQECTVFHVWVCPGV